jgi:isopenicillin N synthase-like dioxygenase
MTTFDHIPIIDVSDIDQVDGAGIDSIVQQLRDVYGNVGFAYLVNHGIDRALIDALFRASAEFHALPPAAKMAIELNELHRGFIPINTSTGKNSRFAVVTKPNQSESFIMMREAGADDVAVRSGHYLAGPNQWPNELPGFRETVVAYHDALAGLGHKLCRAVALALETDADALGAAFAPPTTFLRLLRYPPQPPDPAGALYGSAPHTDFGCITILAQDDIGGLQVRNTEGEWIDAPCIPGSFVMNVGDMLHRWSNGRLLSTPHRVINRSGRERYSCPFFFDPTVTVEVEPLESCITPDNPRQFDGIVYGDFLRAELSAAYDRHVRGPSVVD